MASRRKLTDEHVRIQLTDFAKRHPGVWFRAGDVLGRAEGLVMVRTAWQLARSGVLQQFDLECWECLSVLWLCLNPVKSLTEALREVPGHSEWACRAAQPIEVASG
ncbi:MAG: hypothetical protein JNG90_19845 [Planctomycetaceae bacterium]|nr:hypothetical protein [Planctomycetaceae bacterium]